MVWKAEYFLGPISNNLFDHRLRRGREVRRCVLVPCRGQPIGGKRRWKRSANHPAKKASVARTQYAAFSIAHQLMNDLLGVLSCFGERFGQASPELSQRGGGPNR